MIVALIFSAIVFAGCVSFWVALLGAAAHDVALARYGAAGVLICVALVVLIHWLDGVVTNARLDREGYRR